MKKFTSILLVVMICALSAFSFTGCSLVENLFNRDNSEEVTTGKKVSDKEWKETLTFNFEEQTNFTAVQTLGSTYTRSEAAEYGEWSNLTFIYKYDKDKQVLHIHYTSERYIPETSLDDAYFAADEYDMYLFKHNGSYFSALKYPDEFEWSVQSTTRADFINETEVVSNLMSTLTTSVSLYADLKSMFEYSEETNRYKLATFGTGSLEIGFLGNHGIETHMALTSITAQNIKVYNFGSTNVTVPGSVISQAEDL